MRKQLAKEKASPISQIGLSAAELNFRVRYGKLRLRWKLDLCIASGYRSFDGLHSTPNMWPEAGPLLHSKNHDRDSPSRKVLLIRHVLVGGQQHVEAVRFCGREQFAILERVPALLCSCAHVVPF